MNRIHFYLKWAYQGLFIRLFAAEYISISVATKNPWTDGLAMYVNESDKVTSETQNFLFYPLMIFPPNGMSTHLITISLFNSNSQQAFKGVLYGDLKTDEAKGERLMV